VGYGAHQLEDRAPFKKLGSMFSDFQIIVRLFGCAVTRYRLRLMRIWSCRSLWGKGFGITNGCLHDGNKVPRMLLNSGLSENKFYNGMELS